MGGDTNDPPKKRNRPDVAERCKQKRLLVETCVKACLRKSTIGSNEFKDKIRSAIDERVRAFSIRIHFGSLKLMGMVKTIFSGVPDSELPTLDLGVDIFSKNTIRHLMLGHEGAQQILVNDSVSTYNDAHPRLSVPGERYRGDSNTYSYGATQYVTCLKNSLWMNLTGRIKRFLKEYQRHFEGTVNAIDDGARVLMLYLIHGWDHSKLGLSDGQLSSRCKEVVALHRRTLGLDDGDTVDKVWLKGPENQVSMLKYNVLLNRFYERNGRRTFNIVPVFGMKRHFAYIDTDVFYGIARDLNLIGPSCSQKSFHGVAGDYWHSVFDISRLEGAKNKFTTLVQSDGVALIVHFSRPKNGCDSTRGAVVKNGASSNPVYMAACNGDRVVAFDAGRVNILYGVEKVGNGGECNTYKLTRKQYYAVSGINAARKKTETWSKDAEYRQAALAMAKVSTKGVGIGKHTAFLRLHEEHMDAVWKEMFKRRWARQRLRLYGGKKRAFARFFNGIENADSTGRPVIVAYGSAKFAPGGKGEVSVPVERAYKECSYRFKTAVVDEFRTTKIHFGSDALMDLVQHRRDRGNAKKTMRGLLWCGGAVNAFVDRDKNAALNILRCATLKKRPRVLTRVQGAPALKPVITRWIK
jgi:hypothetical protein